MIDIFDNVFGAAIAFQRLQRLRNTHNFQQGSLANQKKLLDGQARSIDVQNQWGRIQSGLLSQVSTTLGRMEAEMTAVRKLQTESLAIQKELLARDNLQAFLEEFIYQAQKLVAECSSDQSQLPVTTRYFLLQGLLAYVKKLAVGTPMIRGRENKFAFDSAIEQAASAKEVLGHHNEVKEALVWQKNEQKLLAEATAKDQAKKAKFALVFFAIVIGVPVLIASIFVGACVIAMLVNKIRG